MRNHILVVLVLVISHLSNAQIQDVITFSPNNLSISSFEEYTKVSMSGCSTTDIVGYPELPRFEIKYVIPFNKNISTIVITDSVVQTLPGYYTIYPKQLEVPMDAPEPVFTPPDPSIYRSNTPYPDKKIEIAEQHYEMGYHIATIYIYPISYIPSEQILQFCSSVNFTIQFTDNSLLSQRPKKESQRMYEINKTLITTQIRNKNDLDQIIGGPIEITETNGGDAPSIPLLQNELGVIPEYLIITNNTDIHGNIIETYQGQTITDYFQILANWKTQKGIPTKVITIDDISANYTGNDVQERIHNFLSDVFYEHGSMYVLLGGDVNVVPERMVATYNLSGGLFPSDLYYAAIEKTWDLNGNGIYGENIFGNDVDDADNSSEFLHGRLLVENAHHAFIVVNKIINYENMFDFSILDRQYINNIVAMYAYYEEEDSLNLHYTIVR